MEEYNYWEIVYISCESDLKWTVARAPVDWTAYDVRRRILDGENDEIATITEVLHTSDENYSMDYCD